MEYWEYWLESLNCALDETGCFDSISKEKKETIAKSLQLSHEMHGMAFYQPPSTDQTNHEIRNLKNRIKELEKERDQIHLNFKKNVARRWNVDLSSVTIRDNGEAEIHQR